GGALRQEVAAREVHEDALFEPDAGRRNRGARERVGDARQDGGGRDDGVSAVGPEAVAAGALVDRARAELLEEPRHGAHLDGAALRERPRDRAEVGERLDVAARADE